MAAVRREPEPDPGEQPATDAVIRHLRKLAGMPEISEAGRRKVETAIAAGMTINQAMEMSAKMSKFILDKRTGRI